MTPQKTGLTLYGAQVSVVATRMSVATGTVHH